MTVAELILLGVGLAMDAFDVSITKGLQIKKTPVKEGFIIALFFGGFQALMPAIGYFLGQQFIDLIADYDHWIAFILLAAIGGKNIVDVLRDKDESPEECPEYTTNYWELFLLAVATSIDALAVGITLALVSGVNLGESVTIIGVTTFLISYAGVFIGHFFGARLQKQATLAGGVILIILGLRILIQGLGGM